MTAWLPAQPALAQAPDAAAEAASAAPASSVASATSTASAAMVAKPLPARPAASLLGISNWQALSPAQRSALAPLQHEWDKLDSSRRGKWLEVAARFHALPADEQARIRERMIEWTRLSPIERQQARVGFQSTPPLKNDELQAKWEAYQALPPERRQALADRASQKTLPAAGAATSGTDAAPASLAKSNLVPAPSAAPITAVAPSILQARPGATTVLITQAKTLPAHQTAGQPKVLADPNLVDPKTLLPKARAN
ncbi:DUF3106 domain-containing protein [Paucibacter soli]|uniref:DUF3106 domain-containing protein n=1 Tax=Paucibacter soli TaxID=3133433 RepID=UPI00309DF673